jgi:hypothetical protein
MERMVSTAATAQTVSCTVEQACSLGKYSNPALIRYFLAPIMQAPKAQPAETALTDEMALPVSSVA